MADVILDFDNLVKQINPALSADKQAAATIALRLIRSQPQYDLTTFGTNFPVLVTQIKTTISGL